MTARVLTEVYGQAHGAPLAKPSPARAVHKGPILKLQQAVRKEVESGISHFPVQATLTICHDQECVQKSEAKRS